MSPALSTEQIDSTNWLAVCIEIRFVTRLFKMFKAANMWVNCEEESFNEAMWNGIGQTEFLAAGLFSKQSEWSTLFGWTAAGTQLGLAKKYLFPASSSAIEVVPSIRKDSAKLVYPFAASRAASFSASPGISGSTEWHSFSGERPDS
jgi:hypothetical protein